MKAVLFDLDNTLLLEDEVTARAFRTAAAFAREHRPELDKKASLCGRPHGAAERW